MKRIKRLTMTVITASLLAGAGLELGEMIERAVANGPSGAIDPNRNVIEDKRNTTNLPREEEVLDPKSVTETPTRSIEDEERLEDQNRRTGDEERLDGEDPAYSE